MLPIRLPNTNHDSGSSSTRGLLRGSCGRSIAWIGLATLCTTLPPANAQTSDRLSEIASPENWQPHFESWVERFLIARELANVRDSTPQPDPTATYRAVVELTEARVWALRRPSELPAGTVPRLAARGLSTEALAAARLHAKGDLEGAWTAVSTPELARDPSALHLRAQLLDERSLEGTPAEKLDVIRAYRVALSFDRELVQAARARVRIAQIYLQLGFAKESAGSLARALQAGLSPPYDLYGGLTYIEAAVQSRQYEAALAAIERLPIDRMRSAQQRWVLRRRADLEFEQKNFAEAATTYTAFADASREDDGSELDPLSALRAGFAWLASNQLEAARDVLRPLTRPRSRSSSDGAAPDEPLEAESPLRPLAYLLRVQVEAQDQRFDAMDSLAKQAIARDLAAPEAPLLATAALEAQRLKGDTRRIPEGVTELVDLETREPAVGLLTFRMEVIKEERGQGQQIIENLAGLARRLPQGSAQALIHDEMAHRLLERVRMEISHSGTLDPALLDLMERELSARQMNENGLLLALEAFRDSGRLESCARWARALREREVRPLRRGLGAWREVQCRRYSEEEPVTRQELTELADSGTAGPFSLALAALAGEALLREGELESAIRIYERALESFPEPQIVGPVLIRLGELHAAASREGLSRRRLERGLGVTGGSDTATDPFRKVGYLALVDIVIKRGDSKRLEQLLSLDLDRPDPWWPSAYRFLGQRAGLPFETPSTSDGATDPFVQGMQTLEAGRKLRDRLQEVIDRADPGSPTEPGTP